MKTNLKMLSMLLLINVAAFAQNDQIKEAQSLYDKGKSEEALAILNKTEYLILNASDEVKSDYYFLKGNVYKDLAGKNIDAANNFTLASQAYQDVFLYENESGKFKFTVKANAALKAMKSTLVNGAMTDFNAGKFKESAEKSYKVYLFDKKDTLNLYNAAASSINGKDYESAVKYYEILKKINFSGKRMMYYATNKKTKEEDFFVSTKARESAIEQGFYEKPRNELVPSKKIEVNNNLAYAYLEKRDYPKAEAVYNYVLELNPNYLDAYINMAYLKLQVKKDLADEIASLGTSPAEMQKYDKLNAKKDDIARSAIPYLKQALIIEPKNPEATKTLLGVYRSLDMTNEYNALKSSM
ncbi:Tetratricopeptide repeat-containing protein [Flavobacterium sp. CF108]|uniref:tetratricopeptide repeat protein n=1 Tax=unclassified Flavobacterium TaxID=196869 RepID=UPI0008D0D48F|nr:MULTISPECIES: tetratricopeptide repeat protein [unclassified Flavobacterium]SEO83601.1 TPR repeat-containing protein [Flavobacterium sp. fv08]SHG71893.1 Tetratricopeptide repeat-containing protein [Flavobacterium sp. CF108]